MAPATLYKPLTGKLQLYTPYVPDTRSWLIETIGKRGFTGGRGGTWEIAASHFHRRFLAALAQRFGSLVVSHEVREGHATCVTECANANIHTASSCECVCLGANHGRGERDWTHIGERLLVQPGVVVLKTAIYRKL